MNALKCCRPWSGCNRFSSLIAADSRRFPRTPSAFFSPSTAPRTGGAEGGSSRSSSSSSSTLQKPIALFLNCTRLDYDQKLNFESLSDITDFRRNDVDAIPPRTVVPIPEEEEAAAASAAEDEIVRLVNEVHSGTEILILKEMQLPPSAVERFSDSVKLICEAGTGYNNIPIETCRKKDIAVCNIPTYSTDAVAQTAITYIMNFAMNVFRQQDMLRAGDRSNFTGPFALPLMELSGKTLGLVGGSGRIGTRVAEIALVLGMRVVISRRKRERGHEDDGDGHPSLPDDHALANHPNVSVTADVGELLRCSDFVSIHTPLNAQTKGSFGRAQISRMKPTAYLINTSRGGVCDEDELIDCLREGLIAGAGLDVTVSEPPVPDSGLWSLPNAWLSPHIGWRRLETRQRLVDMTKDNVAAYVGGAPINVVS